ncbi:MAG TPA: phosphoribosylanthranilate isomerase [Methylomirabilota bacterium]|nr:phosphoribosylanthranilate isomerase [Methylomirabilota bacterium]
MSVKIKICGITSLADALMAAEAGADALGFIFVEDTPRYVTPARAASIVAALSPFVVSVGVFWDHGLDHVRAVADECRLGAVQFHGSEGPDMVAAAPRPVLKTVKVTRREDLTLLDQYQPAAFLLDSPARWSEGELRAPISWELARLAAPRGRIVLAAGLTPDNVAEAVRIARPYGVDVNSGVEQSPGRKDPDKVRRFIEAARSAVERGPEARGG